MTNLEVPLDCLLVATIYVDSSVFTSYVCSTSEDQSLGGKVTREPAERRGLVLHRVSLRSSIQIVPPCVVPRLLQDLALEIWLSWIRVIHTTSWWDALTRFNSHYSFGNLVYVDAFGGRS